MSESNFMTSGYALKGSGHILSPLLSPASWDADVMAGGRGWGRGTCRKELGKRQGGSLHRDALMG